VEGADEVITRSVYVDGDATAENTSPIPLTNANNKTITRKSFSNVAEGAQISIEYVHEETGAGVELYDQAYEVEPQAGKA
jgi:hypothetical protein